MKKFFNEFKTFISRGNVMDMAIGVIIATAFGKITTSLVGDVFMPLIGWLIGDIDLTQLNITLSPAVLNEAGEVTKEAVVIGIGTFLTQWVFKDQLSNMFRMEYEIKGPFDDPVVEKASRTELGAEIKPAAPGERIRPLFD